MTEGNRDPFSSSAIVHRKREASGDDSGRRERWTMGQGSDHVPSFRLSVGSGEQERFANNKVEDIRRGPAESSSAAGIEPQRVTHTPDTLFPTRTPPVTGSFLVFLGGSQVLRY